jgi:hypothetical protein
MIAVIRALLNCFFALVSIQVFAQTHQIIITEPAALVGRYAALTFTSGPGAFSSATALPQAEFFVIDYLNCAKKTMSSPVQGTTKGKVALIMEADSECRFDEVVRLVEAEGATAAVIALAGNYSARTVAHTSDTRGISIPMLLMPNITALAAIRDAVVKGQAVRSSFQTILYLRSAYGAISILPGQTRAGLVDMIPSIGASINYGSVDLLRNSPGIQTSIRFLSECTDTQVGYSEQNKAIIVNVPQALSFSGKCTALYLISDSAKYEVASVMDIFIGVPATIVDSAWTLPDTPVSIDVLANDVGDESVKVPARMDLNIETEAIDQNITTSQGNWVIKDGKLLFTPAKNFLGLATIRYRVGGQNGGFSNDTLVRVKVASAIPSFANTVGITREFYLPSRDIYFRTANFAEANFVATGGAGPWVETFNAFPVGGTSQICRFYGNTKIDPATNAAYGPQSHFYTSDPGECDALKKSYFANAKSWNFESLDFAAVQLNADKSCPADTVPVYRMYNNGFPKKDSNHRYSLSPEDFRALIPQGWTYEGAVFCVPFAF